MTEQILIVEDDAHVRELVELILSQAGYDVVSARDGAMALELLRHLKPALMLLDINMPGISGLEVLRAVRQLRRLTMPILMMTANQSAETVREVMALGGDGYVLKPFTHEVLLMRVRKALASPPAAQAQKIAYI